MYTREKRDEKKQETVGMVCRIFGGGMFGRLRRKIGKIYFAGRDGRDYADLGMGRTGDADWGLDWRGQGQ